MIFNSDLNDIGPEPTIGKVSNKQPVTTGTFFLKIFAGAFVFLSYLWIIVKALNNGITVNLDYYTPVEWVHSADFYCVLSIAIAGMIYAFYNIFAFVLRAKAKRNKSNILEGEIVGYNRSNHTAGFDTNIDLVVECVINEHKEYARVRTTCPRQTKQNYNIGEKVAFYFFNEYCYLLQ